MIAYGFTDVNVQIPDNSVSPGGASLQVLYRSTYSQGKFKKKFWNNGVWTGNISLPGFQSKYWSGTKLGDETLRNLSQNTTLNEPKNRLLARLYDWKSYFVSVGLDRDAFRYMDCSDKVYSTAINISTYPVLVKMHTQPRHCPTPLYYILPIFSVVFAAIIILIIYCFLVSDDEEEDEGKEEEEDKEEDKIDNQTSSQEKLKTEAYQTTQKVKDNQTVPVNNPKISTINQNNKVPSEKESQLKKDNTNNAQVELKQTDYQQPNLQVVGNESITPKEEELESPVHLGTEKLQDLDMEELN